MAHDAVEPVQEVQEPRAHAGGVCEAGPEPRHQRGPDPEVFDGVRQSGEHAAADEGDELPGLQADRGQLRVQRQEQDGEQGA